MKRGAFDLGSLSGKDRRRFDELAEQLGRGTLRGVPTIDPERLDPATLGVPAEWQPIVRYVRTAPFRTNPDVIGVGLGQRTRGGETTDEICAVVLVRAKRPRSELRDDECLPDHAVFEDQRIPIDVQQGFELLPKPMAGALPPPFPRASNNFSGAAISRRDRGRNPCDGGSLTGHFSGRGLTCAHVALGFGFEAFLGALPQSILWLFESPSGADMIASGRTQPGQDLYQLFEVDTGLPILVPSPFPIPGALSLIYVDGAAGDIRPQAIPPFLPPGSSSPVPAGFPPAPPFSFAGTPPALAPERSTRTGARIRSARIARPGERCFKDGQTTGFTFGRVWLPFFQLYLPMPLGFVSAVVIFDTVLCNLTIAPGDSGSAVLADDMHYLAQVSIGLPPPAGSVTGGAGFTCPVDSNDLIAFTLGTPYYLHELLLGVNLS